MGNVRLIATSINVSALFVFFFYPIDNCTEFSHSPTDASSIFPNTNCSREPAFNWCAHETWSNVDSILQTKCRQHITGIAKSNINIIGSATESQTMKSTFLLHLLAICAFVKVIYCYRDNTDVLRAVALYYYNPWVVAAAHSSPNHVYNPFIHREPPIHIQYICIVYTYIYTVQTQVSWQCTTCTTCTQLHIMNNGITGIYNTCLVYILCIERQCKIRLFILIFCDRSYQL